MVVLGDRPVVGGRTVVVCRAVVEIGALMVGKVVVGDRTVERDSHMYTVGRRKQAKHNIYYFLTFYFQYPSAPVCPIKTGH